VNYLLFYPDEMRAESLACYGHPVVQTPNFDRIAAEGTLFENAYSTHPVCAPSRCALVTGWYPHVQGHRTLRYLLDETQPNFFKYLREAGFTTCLAGKNHCFTEQATGASFDQATTFLRKGQDLASFIAGEKTGGDYTMLRPAVPQREMAEDNDFRYVSDGVEFIRDRARDGKPFFLFQSLNDPHPPYETFEQYYDMYDPDELPPLRDLSWLDGKPALYALIRKYRELDQQDESLFRKINAVYLGMISYTDMLLGRLIAALEETGLYDDTTIVICTDHGDFGGDAGLIEKWPSAVDDMMAKVPLIIRRPGAATGHREAAPVQSFDIFPTVCDVEGIEIRHDQFGVSLRRQLEGEPGDKDRLVYCEGGYDTREPHCFEGTPVVSALQVPGTQYYPKGLQQQEEPESVCRVVMQRGKRYKLNIRTNGENELYDMEADPLEYRNLYDDPEYQAVRDELMRTMLTWLIHTSDVVPWAGHVERT